VQNFCNEAVLLHKGKLVSRGNTSQVIDEYQALLSNAAASKQNQVGLDQSPSYEIAKDGEDKPGTPDFKENSALDNKSPSLRHGTGDARIQNVELLDERSRPVDELAPESDLTVRVHAQYTKDVDGSVVNIVLRSAAGLDVFSTNTTLEKTPLGRRHAGERVIVDFTFRVPLKHGSYSVAAAVSHSKSKHLYLDWISVAVVFKVSRPSGRGAFAGLVHLPAQVEIFEPDRVREPEASD
jgi:hypothetical protein